MSTSLPGPDGRSSRERVLGWLAGGLLGVASLVLFWPATGCGFINCDDNDYVKANADVQRGLAFGTIRSAFTQIVSANWHPVTMLSHTLDCQFFGLNPWGHHLTSVLLHTLNAILVFVLLKRMTGALWSSWCVAALFAWNPLRVESVVWISERKDVLSAFFGLLTLIFYVGYARKRVSASGAQFRPPFSAATAVQNRSDRWEYGLALLFFTLGLLSKPMLVTWPCVMLLLDYWPLRRLDSSSCCRLLKEKIPFFTLALAASVVACMTQKGAGATITVQNLPLYVRGENALVSYCHYLGKIVWPSNLAMFYPFPQPSLAIILGSVGLLAVVFLAAWKWRRRHPYLLMGWLWYCGTLMPVIGFVQVGVQAMADRYTYLPSLGFLILATWGMVSLVAARRFLFGPMLAALGLYLITLGTATRHQIDYWRNSEALFRHALAITSGNYHAHTNLGFALLEKGDIDAAISEFEESARLKPRAPVCHVDLGNALDLKGRFDQATREYLEALRLDPELPGLHAIIGANLVKTGNFDEAIYHLREALRTQPDNANFHNDLANALDGKGQTDDAIREYQEAIRLQPMNAPARSNLGAAYGKKGMVDDAIVQLREAARLKGDDPLTFYNLGMALNEKGRTNEAISQLELALRLKPDFDAARDALNQLRAQ
jgi:Flp pilus assembly protein TadD